MNSCSDTPDDLPDPSAAIVLWRVTVEAQLALLPRKKAERFLRAIGSKLAEEENLSEVFHIRPSSERAIVARARRQAAELYGRFVPIFLARLPRE